MANQVDGKPEPPNPASTPDIRQGGNPPEGEGRAAAEGHLSVGLTEGRNSTVKIARTQAQSAEIDPFDPQNFKKSQDPRLNPTDQQSSCGLPNTIMVGKPKKAWFVRFHADPNYRTVAPIYTDDDTNRRDENSYLFAPGLAIPADIECLVRDTLLVAAVTSAGIPFLYKLPVTDSPWYESGLELILGGMTQWLRITPRDGCYVSSLPIAELAEPRFPAAPFRDWLERAFSKRLITSIDHPVVKKLRGAR